MSLWTESVCIYLRNILKDKGQITDEKNKPKEAVFLWHIKNCNAELFLDRKPYDRSSSAAGTTQRLEVL